VLVEEVVRCFGAVDSVVAEDHLELRIATLFQDKSDKIFKYTYTREREETKSNLVSLANAQWAEANDEHG
jgi:hypothetical protein